MRPFQFLDEHSLFDMLAYVTARYTKMFSTDIMSQDDYLACREMLRLLHTEVEVRKKLPIQHSAFQNAINKKQDQGPVE